MVDGPPLKLTDSQRVVHLRSWSSLWWVQKLEGTNALLVPEHQNLEGTSPTRSQWCLYEAVFKGVQTSSASQHWDNIRGQLALRVEALAPVLALGD